MSNRSEPSRQFAFMPVTAAALVAAAALLLAGTPRHASAQEAKQPAAVTAKAPATAKDAVLEAALADYVIGPSDILAIVFWREKDMSGEVAVRPDGKISLPLLNDVQAAGLTPEQLRVAIAAAAGKYFEEPSVAVVVKQINSLRVFITGEVEKPGAYPLTSPTTVMQLIAMAGGLKEYADKKHIVVMRTENGHQVLFPFDYDALSRRRNVRDGNRQLKPGDTVIVR